MFLQPSSRQDGIKVGQQTFWELNGLLWIAKSGVTNSPEKLPQADDGNVSLRLFPISLQHATVSGGSPRVVEPSKTERRDAHLLCRQ